MKKCVKMLMRSRGETTTSALKSSKGDIFVHLVAKTLLLPPLGTIGAPQRNRQPRYAKQHYRFI